MIAEPSHVADVAAAILESGKTGRVWDVQAGRPAVIVDFPVDFPEVDLAIIGQTPISS